MFGKKRESSDLYSQPMDRQDYDDPSVVHRTHDRLSVDVDENEEEQLDDRFYDAQEEPLRPDYAPHEIYEEPQDRREYNHEVLDIYEIKAQKRNFGLFIFFGLLNLGLLVYIIYLVVVVFTKMA